MNQREEAELRTREKLVAAARRWFHLHGFNRTGVRDIAFEAGVSTGSVFHRWTGKEQVFLDVMGRHWPDPEAFARLVMGCKTLEEARAGAEVFLHDFAGQGVRAGAG